MKLCITGGGTGGHLMIAEALVQSAVSDGHEVIFIGSISGQDRKYFQKCSSFASVYFLHTTGVVNQRGFKKVLALFKVFIAFFKSRSILKKHKIQAVYSVGGFSAAPASFACISKFLPLFIHEQNAVTGRLNALLKPFAKSFISAYDKDSQVQGYPVKDVYFQKARVRKKLQTIIFLGGSRGARAINDLALSVAQDLKLKNINIIHISGENDYERVKNEYKKLGIKVELHAFTKKLNKLISKADLAISRAGASTLWELTASGLVSLFIPYPYAAGDHQYYNARFIVENNLGWCERESENLKEKLLNILDEDLEVKSKELLQYSHQDVANKMIQNVLRGINA
jgi:UDP-N-acetylglucosamine--N-acetylmuramyl-(pentapeptide) pyrophosphoryl-undecaprenol N-acetylglucosamine transferase